jgi:3-oxoacyl-[acyl-carrier-protein] synthase-3
MSEIQTKILGSGMAFPKKVMTNADLEKIVETSDEWIRERTGIHERHVAEPSESNSDFGALAAKEALEMAGLQAKDLDLIIFATVTPDRVIPSTASTVASKIGCPEVQAMDISAACSGFLYGFAMADNLVKSKLKKNVLVIGAETLSRIVNWEDRNTCILFGDGAGAAILGPTPEGEDSKVFSSELFAEGALKDLLKTEAGGSAQPFNLDVIANRSYCLTMKGKEIFKTAVRTLSKGAKTLLQKHEFDLDELDWFVPHQANMRIIEAVAKRVGVPMEKVVVNVSRFGNTSGATVPTAFHEAVKEGRIKRGDLVLFDVFGAGLTYGASLIRY